VIALCPDKAMQQWAEIQTIFEQLKLNISIQQESEKIQ